MSVATCIKFCGLRRTEDVAKAVELRAAFLGFVFVPRSPREVDVARVRAVLDAVDTAGARRVGVFRDQPAVDVNAVVRACGLDLVQLHGHEPRDYASAIEVPVLRVVRVASASPGAPRVTRPGTGARLAPEASNPIGNRVPQAPNVEAVLLDAQDGAGRSGGLGLQIAPWALQAALEALPEGTRVFLSGGLTPENVAALASRYAPFAVDVSSGVESAPGVKDHAKMERFVAALGGAT